MSRTQAVAEIFLDAIERDDELAILPDFAATVDGRRVWVTAVLERTVVVEPAPGEPKVLVNQARCLVDPRQIRFGPVASRSAAKRGRENARRNRMQEDAA